MRGNLKKQRKRSNEPCHSLLQALLVVQKRFDTARKITIEQSKFEEISNMYLEKSYIYLCTNCHAKMQLSKFEEIRET